MRATQQLLSYPATCYLPGNLRAIQRPTQQPYSLPTYPATFEKPTRQPWGTPQKWPSSSCLPPTRGLAPPETAPHTRPFGGYSRPSSTFGLSCQGQRPIFGRVPPARVPHERPLGGMYPPQQPVRAPKIAPKGSQGRKGEFCNLG